MLKKGQVFQSPDGHGYTLNRDVNVGDALAGAYFEPFGGAALLKDGEPMPRWLGNSIERQSRGL